MRSSPWVILGSRGFLVMDKYELQQRTKKFNVNVIFLCNKLPKTIAGYEVGKQLIRSAGSVGSNYRAACRAKSKADFIYKLDVVLEESDESLYWLEVIRETKMIIREDLDNQIQEAEQLVRIFSASNKTAKNI